MPDSSELDAARDLLRFIDASPTPYHAVAETARRLGEAGFTELDEREEWKLAPGDRRFVTKSGGTLCAFVVGSDAPSSAGFVAIAAHTDSPGFRLKPLPEVASAGFRQVGVEVYGGVLHSTWMDRDLSIAGRVALRGGTSALVDLRRPVCRMPNLAIHLSRSVNADGLVLNPQQHLVPLLAPGEGDGVLELIAAALRASGTVGVDAEQIVAQDLCLYDVQPAVLVGPDASLIAAARLDNLGSCHAATCALLQAGDPGSRTRVIALFDHEEVGSQSDAGARSRFLGSVLDRIAAASPGAGRDALPRALARSLLVSADMAHAVHPNYADKHDKLHGPKLGDGPAIKINAGRSYATDALAAAAFEDACREAGFPAQRFVSRNDIACGSTVGPISAAGLAIRTVDVGNPMLAMHSCRETAGTADVKKLTAALVHVLKQREAPPPQT